MIAHGEGRDHWLVFASGIEHTFNVAAMLQSFGISTTYVHSKMGDAERDANIADFVAGKYRVMVNNGILTTGFDFPGIDLIGILRPTQSPSLWVQMLGRGTRPFYIKGYNLGTREGRLESIANSAKQNCLVMDFAGNTKRLGPINDPVLPRKKSKGASGTAPVKICEACNTYNHASARFCVSCGQEFPKLVKIRQYASTDELIASGQAEMPITEIFKVDRVIYNEHRKDGRPPSIQASYFCGMRMFKDWICLEHGGLASKKARDWWRKASGEPPANTLEALSRLDELKSPMFIKVWLKPKYDEILGVDYEGNGNFGDIK
jgi:DNA repair protein RadD